MNKLSYLFLPLLLICLSGCRKEAVLTPQEKSTSSVPANELDHWLTEQLTRRYNIEVSYKEKSFREPHLYPNQAPDPTKIKPVIRALAILWIHPFEQATDTLFMKRHAPRELRLFGRPNLNEVNRGEIATSLGEAILPLYNINQFSIAQDGRNEAVFELLRMTMFAFAKRLLYFRPADLNRMAAFNQYPYFNWSVDADAVGEGSYRFIGNAYCLKRGFITNGAMSNAIDDFAETFSTIVCMTTSQLNEQLQTAQEYGSLQSAEILRKKIRFVDDYLLNNFKIRREVQLTRVIASAIRKYNDTIQSETSKETEPEL